MKKGSQVPNSNLPVIVNHLVSGKCSELKAHFRLISATRLFQAYLSLKASSRLI